jgi:thiol-disulfide isomerase/thioredoxin
MPYELEYIGATWCAPCKTVKPKVIEQATKYAIPIKLYDLEADADKFDVDAVKKLPTLRVLQDGKVVAEGTPDEVRASSEPFVRQFINAEPDGPVPFHYPGGAYRSDLLQAAA